MKLGLKFLILFLFLFSVSVVSGVVRLNPSDFYVKVNEQTNGDILLNGNLTTDCITFGDNTVQCSVFNINDTNTTTIWQRTLNEVSLVNPKANVTIAGNLNVTGSGYFGNNSIYVGGVKMSEGNDGFLNVTQPVVSTYFIGDGSKLTNITFNASTGDFTFNGNIILNNHNVTDVECINFHDNTTICTAPIDSIWDILGSKYLFNDSGILAINENVLNSTILANDIDLWENKSGVAYYQGNINVSGTGYFGGDLYMNQSTLYFLDQNTGEYGKLSKGIYGGNNQTLLWNGEPIIVGLGAWNITNSNYLINISDVLNLNESKLNFTILNIAQQFSNDTDTSKKGDGIYLFNDSTTVYLNESKLNNTVSDIAQISNFTLTFTMNVVGGTGGVTSPIILNYLITQITVTPPSSSANYRFKLNETTSGEIIDRDRKPHHNVWNIYKTHALSDTTDSLITNANIDGTYNIKIKYINNVVNV